MKIGLLTSHPIQYQAPLFRALANRMDLKVYFAHRATPQDQARAGFNIPFDWDADLLDGYSYKFLENASRHPDLNHFLGCDTPGVQAEIQSRQFDAFIVSGWNFKSYWQAVRACRRQNIPVLVRGDSQLETGGPLRNAVKQISHRFLLRQFDAFLTVGQRNKNYLLHYGVKPDRIFFAPHCVDNQWFYQHSRLSKEQYQKERESFGFKMKDLVLLFAGKYEEKKRPLDLVQAIAVLKKKNPQCRGLFVGSGKLESRLKDEALRRNVPIHFAGFKNQSEMPNIYGIADILVLPSDGRETWGLVVNEAMACGVPAVVSDRVGCSPDLIESGVTGEIYPAGNIQALVEAILGFQLHSDSRPVRDNVLRKSREYSIEKAAEGFQKALSWVMGQKK